MDDNELGDHMKKTDKEFKKLFDDNQECELDDDEDFDWDQDDDGK